MVYDNLRPACDGEGHPIIQRRYDDMLQALEQARIAIVLLIKEIPLEQRRSEVIDISKSARSSIARATGKE